MRSRPPARARCRSINEKTREVSKEQRFSRSFSARQIGRAVPNQRCSRPAGRGHPQHAHPARTARTPFPTHTRRYVRKPQPRTGDVSVESSQGACARYRREPVTFVLGVGWRPAWPRFGQLRRVSVVVAPMHRRTRRLFASFSYFRLPFLPTASIRASTALQLGDLIGWKQVCSIRVRRSRQGGLCTGLRDVGHPSHLIDGYESERSQKGEPRRQG